MRAKRGFTLVEILIVVVILGILAAIVIPQFTDASTDAKDSSLKSNLHTARSQIELYKVQHSDALPGDGNASFIEAMTAETDAGGDVGNGYGPYLQSIPVNPYNNLKTVEEDGTVGNNSHGWHFDTSNGAFQADDSNSHAAW